MLVAGAALFFALANAALLRTATILADIPVPPEKPATNWPAAASTLEALARADVVVTTEELSTVDDYGRYDYPLRQFQDRRVVRRSNSMNSELISGQAGRSSPR